MIALFGTCWCTMNGVPHRLMGREDAKETHHILQYIPGKPHVCRRAQLPNLRVLAGSVVGQRDVCNAIDP